jgi:hypothetical protein
MFEAQLNQRHINYFHWKKHEFVDLQKREKWSLLWEISMQSKSKVMFFYGHCIYTDMFYYTLGETLTIDMRNITRIRRIVLEEVRWFILCIYEERLPSSIQAMSFWHGYVLHEGIKYKSRVPHTSQMTSRLLRHTAAGMRAHNVLCNSYNTQPLLCARITCYVTVITVEINRCSFRRLRFALLYIVTLSKIV